MPPHLQPLLEGQGKPLAVLTSEMSPAGTAKTHESGHSVARRHRQLARVLGLLLLYLN